MTTSASTRLGGTPRTAESDALYSKVTWRLLPLIFVCYIFNYMDRTNIGFAQLQMKDQLGFGDAVFGLGAGVFFVSYAASEIPSNVLLTRWGVRKTLLRIMVLWGLASACMMFVSTPMQFYVLRFFLGAFEAGFVPGVLYYLTLWYPSHRRGQVTALFFAAYVTAPMFSGPLAGLILAYLDGLQGLKGWQWLFLVEGIPSAFLGVACYFYLDDRPADAKWLTEAEKTTLTGALEADRAGHDDGHHHTLTDALRDWRVWFLGAVYFLCVLGSYALAFWQPTILKGMGLSYLEIGLASAVPPLVSIIFMLFVGRSSDRTGERRWHFAGAACMGAVGLAATTLFTHNPVAAVLCLAIGHAGIASCIPIFWTMPGTFLSKTAAAGGIALISTIGVTAGAIAPSMVAYTKQLTGDFSYALYLMAAGLLLGGILVVIGVSARTLAGLRPVTA
ncbi:MAG: MFS transporter [Rhizobiales bacterium]|nr:MFS transporter [Hyphomicrobiales bacterium]